MNPLSVIQQFYVRGVPSETIPFGNGHIHDTYKVLNDDPESPDYILQKVNHEVFPSIAEVMQNIERVTSHLRQKESFKETTLRVVPTVDEQLFYTNGNEYWRVFEFVNGGRSYEKASTPDIAFEAARTYGAFLAALSDFSVDQLHVTIPDFHNMMFRVSEFEKALSKASDQRKEQAFGQIEYVKKVAGEMCELYDTSIANDLPLRVTHGDTKFNNVLFNAKGGGLCVIDLDTVMPGYLYFDIGDGVRTGVVSTEEDEVDLQKVQVDITAYKAYVSGYINATKHILSPLEYSYIPKAGPYMAFIMGIRFLTDYLAGDVYYKTRYQEHNLHRARCQFYVCDLLKECEPAIKELVEKREDSI